MDRFTLSKLTAGMLSAFALFFSLSAQAVTLGWKPSPSPNIVSHKVYYGDKKGSFDGFVLAPAPLLRISITTLLPGRTYYFAVTAVNKKGRESDFSNIITYTTPGASPNTPPRADSFLIIAQQNTARAIQLSGVDAEGSPLQYILLNPPAHGRLTGKAPALSYVPDAGFVGTDQFTYRTFDGAAFSEIATVFVTVQSQNRPPTLNPLPDLNVTVNSGPRTVSLSGITAGGTELQTLKVTALTSDPNLIRNLAVNYKSPAKTGALTFTPAPNAKGAATITVSVDDGQPANNFVSASFSVTVFSPGPSIKDLVELSNDARDVRLGWKTDQAATCFVEYGTTPALGKISAETSGTVHILTITELQPDTGYYFRVNARNQSGNAQTEILSAQTEPISVITWPAEAGLVDGAMKRFASQEASGGNYIATTTKNTGGATYRFPLAYGLDYRLWARVKAPAGGGSFSVSADGRPENLFAAVPVNGAVNVWRWMLLSGSGGGPAIVQLGDGEHQIRIRGGTANLPLDEFALSNDPKWKPILPDTKPILSARASLLGTIDLEWNTQAGNANGVAIEWSTDGKKFFRLAETPAIPNAYRVSGLPPGPKYSFRCYAYNTVDVTDYSAVAQAKAGQ